MQRELWGERRPPCFCFVRAAVLYTTEVGQRNLDIRAPMSWIYNRNEGRRHRHVHGTRSMRTNNQLIRGDWSSHLTVVAGQSLIDQHSISLYPVR